MYKVCTWFFAFTYSRPVDTLSSAHLLSPAGQPCCDLDLIEKDFVAMRQADPKGVQASSLHLLITLAKLV
jgi:hypothetical protein